MSRMNKTIALAALLMMTGCGASFANNHPINVLRPGAGTFNNDWAAG